MSSVINTNINTLTAQRNLGMNQATLSTSMQRLSSGLRINSAKDDAAGLAISDRMTAQIRGLTQAGRNANDAISMSQTAEGALGGISNNLQRIRELAVQAANGTNSASDRSAIQAEVSQLQSEIGRVASSTQFNGLNLLDGALANASFQVGANGGQVINFGIASAKATDIGINQLTSVVAGSLATAVAGAVNTTVAETAMTISGNGATTAAITWGVNATGKTIAQAINTAAGATGVVATASTTATITGVYAGVTNFTLNGTAISAAVSGAANSLSTNLSSVATAINAQTGKTGVTATADNLGNLVLTDATGGDIVMTTTDATATTGFVTASMRGADLTAGGNSAGVTIAGGGATVGAQVTLSSSTQFSTAGATDTTLFATASASSTLSNVATIDVTTVAGATNALSVVDGALGQISSQRANLGAVQNRFTSTIDNLASTTENLTASRSRILDADFAAETANLSRSQILQQAGTAMVAQANQLPQGVLALLR